MPRGGWANIEFGPTRIDAVAFASSKVLLMDRYIRHRGGEVVVYAAPGTSQPLLMVDGSAGPLIASTAVLHEGQTLAGGGSAITIPILNEMVGIQTANGTNRIAILAANLTANPFEAVTTVTVQIVTLLVGDQEFDSAKTLAAFALGLALFVVTLALNVVALHTVRKYREQYE